MYRDFKVGKLSQEKIEYLKRINEVIAYSKTAEFDSAVVTYNYNEDKVDININNMLVSLNNNQIRFNINKALLAFTNDRVKVRIKKDIALIADTIRRNR